MTLATRSNSTEGEAPATRAASSSRWWARPARLVAVRLLAAVPTLLGVALFTFLLAHLAPGNPLARFYSGYRNGMPPGLIKSLEAKYGLDKPLIVQFGDYLQHAVTGNLGISVSNNDPVSQLILQAAPYTLELAAVGLAVSVVLGVLAGVIAAVWGGSWLDRILQATTLFGMSAPEFWVGQMAVLLFAVDLAWFPASGAAGVNSLILPVAVLGLRGAAPIARFTRTGMMDSLNQAYIVAARAKGISESLVIVRHALKNAFIPVITIIGLNFGYLIGGAVVLEAIFNRPGLGTLLLNGILASDYPVIEGTTLFIALIYIGSNIVVDVSYLWFDPRVRLGE
jgi:peptide/nickel transport system permease protein